MIHALINQQIRFITYYCLSISFYPCFLKEASFNATLLYIKEVFGWMEHDSEGASYLSWSRSAGDIRLSRTTAGHGKMKE